MLLIEILKQLLGSIRVQTPFTKAKVDDLNIPLGSPKMSLSFKMGVNLIRP
ncbi:MAG TPA: hypothetical protein VFJ51_14570 [Nitrososphaeraceae archaeon]|nr:hypothetical protein [Nitrososphaeraceae archaeon]